MTVQTLLSQTGVQGAVGPTVSFAGSDDVRTCQINPIPGQGFSGTIVIEGSTSPSPGNNDFVTLATVVMSGHTSNLSLDIDSDIPFVRVRLAQASLGAVAIYGSSRFGSISGTQNSGSNATAIVSSSLRVAGNGNNFRVNTPVVPSFTTDDVFYSGNFDLTLTEYLDGLDGATGFQPKIGNGNITANQNDVNVLTGTAAYGLTVTDMQKLADVNATSSEINRLTGVTSNVQTQLTALSTGKADVSTVPANKTWVDNFFDANPTVQVSDLAAFNGLTASAADLNVFTGTSGNFTSADLTKLGDITATASEINGLSGFTGTSTDLNRIVGLTSSVADLNAIDGIGGVITVTELSYLSGLTQNVQAALSALPSFIGLTASVNDLNTLTGIFSGSGAYPSQISATEISYLNGLSSNIQTQLNGKRNIGVPIGIAEISGASITTTELNYLQGANSNIQAQIDSIVTTAITPLGGTFTGAVTLAVGSAAAPSLRFTGALTTGNYRFGGSGWGLAISGVRFLSADGTDFVVGNGIVNGPLLKGAGFSSVDPQYSYFGDTDTGVARISANSQAIVGGAVTLATFDGTASQVTLGGNASSNIRVNVSGIFGGEKLLGTATIQMGSTGSTGQTTLYTVPTGRSAIVTKILVVITSVTGSVSSDYTINFGLAPSYTTFVDNSSNPTIFNPSYGFDTPLQILTLGAGSNEFPAISGSSGADFQMLTSGQVLRADRVALDSTATNFTLTVYVMGLEV